MKIVFNDGTEIEAKINFSGGKCTIMSDEPNLSGFKTFNNGALIGEYSGYRKLYKQESDRFILVKDGKSYDEEQAEAEAKATAIAEAKKKAEEEAKKYAEEHAEEIAQAAAEEARRQESILSIEDLSVCIDEMAESIADIFAAIDELAEMIAE